MAEHAARWSRVGEAYRRSFASLCAGTVETLIADTVGRRHLDVGSGTGTLAAAAVRAGREVHAVDADPDMVELTRGSVPEARVERATLPDLGLPPAGYHAVTANFVVNHVADPRAAVRELGRVLRPGGRVAITTWTNEPTAQARLFAESLDAAGAVAVPGRRLPPELDFERSPRGLAALAVEVGLTPIGARRLDWTWVVDWADLWSGISGGVASIGETYLAQDAATRAQVEAEMRRRARLLEVDGRIHLPSRAAYLVATR